jgi:Rha family phage regulatory protein
VAPYIDSREVASIIGKQHGHLMRDITGYIITMQRFNQSNFGVVDFFIESSFIDVRGREMPCYLLSKMGCEMVANKLTGAKGVLFTATYVKKFSEMEAAEREAAIKAHARPRLSEFNSAVRNVLSGMSCANTKPSRVMSFLNGVYEPLGIEVIPFHETDYFGYFTVTEIALILDVYSGTGRPHGHAISAIISKIDNHAHHAVVVPFGLVGVTLRYDTFIVEAVMKWLLANNLPSEIPYQGFKYHIYYKPRKMYTKDDGIIDLYDDDDYLDDFFTADELDELCSQYDDCDECPGFNACCEED